LIMVLRYWIHGAGGVYLSHVCVGGYMVIHM
jgi:hypothetical protein